MSEHIESLCFDQACQLSVLKPQNQSFINLWIQTSISKWKNLLPVIIFFPFAVALIPFVGVSDDHNLKKKTKKTLTSSCSLSDWF